MSTYTTAAQDAAAIRAELKKTHGWTSKQVSVRSECYSMGSSINVVIKARGVSRAAVEAVANQYDRVRRCEVTGEILSGGNRFVHVRFDHDLVDAEAAKLMPWLASIPVHPSRCADITVGDAVFVVGRTSDWRYSLSILNDRNVPVQDAHTVSAVIARHAIENELDLNPPAPASPEPPAAPEAPQAAVEPAPEATSPAPADADGLGDLRAEAASLRRNLDHLKTAARERGLDPEMKPCDASAYQGSLLSGIWATEARLKAVEELLAPAPPSGRALYEAGARAVRSGALRAAAGCQREVFELAADTFFSGALGGQLAAALRARGVLPEHVAGLCATAAEAGLGDPLLLTDLLGACAADYVTPNALRLAVGEPEILEAMARGVRRQVERAVQYTSTLDARPREACRPQNVVDFPRRGA